MMTAFASAVILATVVAFGIWVVLLRVLERTRMPFAGVIAAIVSWACASLSLLWTVDVLERAGW